MSKHERITEQAKRYDGQGVDARYAGYFALFNEQKFYEAHDVLENLWLADRHGANGNFYKGLIQLAGAFVHLQKDRLGPAAALFNLARANLEKYPGRHERLDVAKLLRLILEWQLRLSADNKANPLKSFPAPQVDLLSA